MLEVRLFPGLPGGRWARLGAITGVVEQCVEPSDPEGFAVLLDHLLLDCNGTSVGPGRALDLTVNDCDRIAAEIYRQEYGTRLESNLPCRQCGKDFRVSFELEPLIRQASQIAAEGVEGPDDNGDFRAFKGPRFRLPTLRDQLAVRGLDADRARMELLSQCVNSDLKDEEIAAVERAMEAVGPLISGPITMSCPHCKFFESTVEFSIQNFLLEALAFEKRFLHYEVHYLARTYGWGRGEVLAMSKSDRRIYARMVLAEQVR
ncbi:MAG TPA: hypothetical protein VIS96_03355 [Terrimicrobiaceae bacterium]